VGFAQLVHPVLRIQRMHLQRRNMHQKTRADEFVVLLVIAKHVADVLAQEALDALPELLDAIHIGLRHSPGSVWSIGNARLELRDPLLHREIP
jgi:hypothetical protein